MALFDNVLWPEPAEAALLESLCANLQHTRARLANVVHGFLSRPTRNHDRASATDFAPCPSI